MNLLLDLFDRRSRLFVIHRHTYNLAAGFFKAKNLSNSSGYISRFCSTHALNDHFVAAADRQITDPHWPRILSQECHIRSLL
ncbi:hypothetical protein D3C71_1908050 [compost metagenome]